MHYITLLKKFKCKVLNGDCPQLNGVQNRYEITFDIDFNLYSVVDINRD